MSTPIAPTVINHPLILHKLSIMRDVRTSTAKFRRLLTEISLLMAYEVTRDMPLTLAPIETPLTAMDAPMLEGKKVAVISVMRAGQGIVDGILQLIPSARVGHIGLYRDPETLQAVEYYFKVPERMDERDALIVDPMLATGHSAAAAISHLKERAPARTYKFLCLLAAPEGIAHLQAAHPDVPIYTAAIDSHLNDHGYIVPGLGDAGDRLYGTR